MSTLVEKTEIGEQEREREFVEWNEKRYYNFVICLSRSPLSSNWVPAKAIGSCIYGSSGLAMSVWLYQPRVCSYVSRLSRENASILSSFAISAWLCQPGSLYQRVAISAECYISRVLHQQGSLYQRGYISQVLLYQQGSLY